MNDLALVLLVAGVVFLGSLMQRVGGMGVGLLCGPVLSIAIGPVEGILVVNALAATNAVMSSYSMRRDIDWNMVRTIGSVMVLGSLAGAWLIRTISTPELQVVVGLLIIIALLIVTFGKRFVPPARGNMPPLIAGTIGGFTNTLAAVAGPIITVYGHAAGWEHRRLAATLQPLFVISGTVSFTVKELTGAASMSSIPWAIWPAAIVAMVVAIWVGAKVARKVNQATAKNFAVVLAMAGAISVMVRGALAM